MDAPPSLHAWRGDRSLRGPGAWVVPLCAAADGMLALSWRTRAGDRQRLWDGDSGTLAARPHLGSVPRIRSAPPAQGTSPRRETQALPPLAPGVGVPVRTRGGGWDCSAARPWGRAPLLEPTDPSLLLGAWPGACFCPFDEISVGDPHLLQTGLRPALPAQARRTAHSLATHSPPGLTLPERTGSPPSRFHKGTEQEVVQGWGRPQTPRGGREPD